MVQKKGQRHLDRGGNGIVKTVLVIFGIGHGRKKIFVICNGKLRKLNLHFLIFLSQRRFSRWQFVRCSGTSNNSVWPTAKNDPTCREGDEKLPCETINSRAETSFVLQLPPICQITVRAAFLQRSSGVGVRRWAVRSKCSSKFRSYYTSFLLSVHRSAFINNKVTRVWVCVLYCPAESRWGREWRWFALLLPSDPRRLLRSLSFTTE